MPHLAYAAVMLMDLYRYWRGTRNGEAMKSANLQLAKMGWPQRAKRLEIRGDEFIVHLDDGGKAIVKGKPAAELTNLFLRY